MTKLPQRLATMPEKVWVELAHENWTAQVSVEKIYDLEDNGFRYPTYHLTLHDIRLEAVYPMEIDFSIMPQIEAKRATDAKYAAALDAWILEEYFTQNPDAL